MYKKLHHHNHVGKLQEITIMKNSNIDQLGKQYNRWAIIIICVGAFLILVFPWLLSQHHWKFSFAETGQIGDTIGGITAPIIGFMSAILIYFSFMIQYRANQMQWKAIRDEQLLNRLPLSLQEIKNTIERDKSRTFSFHVYINEVRFLVVNDSKKHNRVFSYGAKLSADLNIYMKKIILIIHQINNSEIDPSLKTDFLLDLINHDNYLFDTLFELHYHLDQILSNDENMAKRTYFIGPNVAAANGLKKKIRKYIETMASARNATL